MPVFILSMLGFGKMAAQAVLAWLSKRSLAEIVCIAMGLALTLDHLALLMSHRHAAKVETQLRREIASHEADRVAYVKAQTNAAVANKAQVANVEHRQQEINNAKVGYLTGRLQLISDELRRQNAAAESAPHSAQASPGVESPCRVIDPAWMCLSPADRLLAAQNEERHDELIDLVIEQSTVDPNKP